MRLAPADELFVSSLLEGVSAAIRKRSQGDMDREWELANRLATVLATQGHATVAQCFGLAKATRYDTPITVVVDGEPHATYVAGNLRNDVWIGMVLGVQSMIDIPPLRDQIMGTDEIGDDALPDLIDEEEDEA